MSPLYSQEGGSCSNIDASVCPALRRRLPPLALAALALLLAGCVPAHRHPSWAIFPLQRQRPHDGLAVVNQPDGYGVHLWLETDTRQQGRCSPRWVVPPARLFNGNGTAPFSSGLATAEEFFAVVQRSDVQRALRTQLEQLCKARAPRATFTWLAPPKAPTELKVEPYPLLEEPDLLSDPNAVLEQEQRFLGSDGTPASSAE